MFSWPTFSLNMYEICFIVTVYRYKPSTLCAPPPPHLYCPSQPLNLALDFSHPLSSYSFATPPLPSSSLLPLISRTLPLSLSHSHCNIMSLRIYLLYLHTFSIHIFNLLISLCIYLFVYPFIYLSTHNKSCSLSIGVALHVINGH